MRYLLLILLTSVIFVFPGCTTIEEEPAPPPSPPVQKVFTPTTQPGQIPEQVLREASERYEGSYDLDGAAGAADAVGNAGQQNQGLKVVLGPINSERLGNMGGRSRDAGQRIREVISQKIALTDITLVDAPEERFINDSPRPDLARKGVKYVIKGIAGYSSDSDENTVFLRVVATKTGKVQMVASARAAGSDEAAARATVNLLEKLKEVQ